MDKCLGLSPSRRQICSTNISRPAQWIPSRVPVSSKWARLLAPFEGLLPYPYNNISLSQFCILITCLRRAPKIQSPIWEMETTREILNVMERGRQVLQGSTQWLHDYTGLRATPIKAAQHLWELTWMSKVVHRKTRGIMKTLKSQVHRRTTEVCIMQGDGQRNS